MAFTMGLVGAGQFAGQFATLFHHHPGISAVHVTDVVPARATELVASAGLAGTFESFENMIASPAIDSIAIFTQRWMHGPLVVEALRAGKHVYSAVPMAITVDEIGAIIDAVYSAPFHPEAIEARYRHPDHPDRKPNPGMLLRAIKEHALDPTQSFIIGDQKRDLQAGERAGVAGYLFEGGDLDTFVRDVVGL